MKDFVWQRSLAVADTDASGYHDNARKDLIDTLESPPRAVLDIGCGTGATCTYLKTQYPSATVWGIEVNRQAAEIAKERLDHVACGKFEEIDLEAFGIAPGSLDLVICADVLEHMYDPWSVVVRLRDYLAADGKLVISIPNLRYLPLLDDLAHGYFRYADWGVLDITHLRFFTRKELERFLFETGYQAVAWRFGFDPTLTAQYEQAKKTLPATIDTGKILLRDLSDADLQELYSAQFFVTARKGDGRLTGYAPPRSGCYFWQGQQSEYWKFLAAHKLLEHEARAFESHLATLSDTPSFDLFVVHGGDIQLLSRTIASASRWLFDGFRLTVIASESVPAALANHARIAWIQVSSIQGDCPWMTLKEVVTSSQADWVMILESGDELVEHALLYLAEQAIRNKDLVALYADEDAIDSAGRPDRPYFKPDFSPDYFLAFDYLGDAVAIKREALQAVGGLNPLDDNPVRGALLRLFQRFGGATIGHVPDVLYHRNPTRSLNRQLRGGDAIEPALRELLPDASLQPGWLPKSVRMLRTAPSAARIGIIVEAVADVSIMRNLVESVWGGRTYPAADLIIFAAPDLPPEVMTYLQDADSRAPEGLVIYTHPDGSSRMGRVAAALSEGNTDVVLMARADIQPVSENWLLHLVTECLQASRGLVAPKLVDRQGRIIGNSLLLGVAGFAIGLGHGEALDAPGPYGRLLLPQNPSAVTPDVVMFSRQALESAGGFDDSLGAMGSMIDLAMRLQQRGMQHLWTPEVTLVCLEQSREKLSVEEEQHLLERWLPQMARDPAYTPNGSRTSLFAPREHPQVSRLGLPWKPLPRLMAFPADMMGCGHYRVIEPFHAARQAELIDGYLGSDHYDPLDMAIFEADTLLLQRQVSDAQIQYLNNYRRFFKLRLVYELDDLITNLPVESHHKGSMPKDIATRLRKGLDLCDRFIVSTEPLKEAYSGLIKDIRVVPNRIDAGKWAHLAPKRRAAVKPRVGWAGGVSHAGDLALITDLIKATANEVDWIFFGMCPADIRSFVREFHAGVPTPDYPAKLASLNLDLAIAPIAENHFNDCKSNLKLLEYGVLGFPVIATDFGPYRRSREFPGVTLVKNRHKDWLAAIKAHTHDLDESARRGDALRTHIHAHWMLQDHVNEWRSAWFDF